MKLIDNIALLILMLYVLYYVVDSMYNLLTPWRYNIGDNCCLSLNRFLMAVEILDRKRGHAFGKYYLVEGVGRSYEDKSYWVDEKNLV